MADQKDPATAARPLFRQQAVNHIAVRKYGNVVLTADRSHRIATLVLLGVVLAILVFFFTFSTARKERCEGVIVPSSGVLRIVPMQGGIIVERRVVEGQKVRAGDVLFVLSDERSTNGASSIEKTISELLEARQQSYQRELGQARAQGMERAKVATQRAADLNTEIDRIGEQLVLQKRRVGLIEQSVHRYEELAATHYISAAQMQDKQAELLDQRQRSLELERALAAARRDLDAAQAEARDLVVQMERDTKSLERNKIALEQDLMETHARRDIVMRAPTDGVLGALNSYVGQTVSAGTVLAFVLPAGAELEGELYVPSRSAGFVRPGMNVLVRYQAYPYQKFGQHAAKVIEVSSTSLRPDEVSAFADLSRQGEPLYRVRVKLERQDVLAYGRNMPLKSGMLMDASIILEHRKLYQWILDPLYSISGRI